MTIENGHEQDADAELRQAWAHALAHDDEDARLLFRAVAFVLFGIGALLLGGAARLLRRPRR